MIVCIIKRGKVYLEVRSGIKEIVFSKDFGNVYDIIINYEFKFDFCV